MEGWSSFWTRLRVECEVLEGRDVPGDGLRGE